MLKIVPGISKPTPYIMGGTLGQKSSLVETNSLISFYQGGVGGIHQQTINIRRAIGKWESSGDYRLPGKSKEYGKYQFTDECWKKIAPRCGVFTSLRRATREEQDLVMYYQIRVWLEMGYTVLEIASMWNAGDGEPRAYTGVFWTNTKTHRAGSPSVGVNSYGAYFNVPQYANNVQKSFLQYQYAS